MWSNLTSFSLDAQITQLEILRELVGLLARCPLRRFRLVVNAFNGYNVPNFGPELVGRIVRSQRNLEELILDQFRTSVYTPLPGSLVRHHDRVFHVH